ncbi:MAG: UDP-2,4-diacetamido-2,4,6-trideoxy-beta-L-altropyranose hydrolase [Desulfobacterales bacterium]|jgi:UDP-2,4-diacetamido-2,4,6-trideoxy-beta-L-altropyranose hydrolase
MTLSNLIIRADGNARIGSGHLMRCLTLAQGWRSKGGKVTFITACNNHAFLRRLYQEEFQVVKLREPYPNTGDWRITSKILSDIPDGWVVLDGYHFDSKYHCQIQETSHRLLVIDDSNHLDIYHANILLNPNINAENLHYTHEPYTRPLLGTRYFQLRSEFLKWRNWRRSIPRLARKVLVTLGGGDADNQTLKSIQAIQESEVEGLEATVVIGPDNPNFEELNSAACGSKLPMRLISNAENMSELMAWADLAISAGGSTCCELAFMGMPVLVITIAENQRTVAEGLDQEGAVVNLGWYADITPTHISRKLSVLAKDKDLRAAMSKRGRALVDGRGNERVLKDIMAYA